MKTNEQHPPAHTCSLSTHCRHQWMLEPVPSHTGMLTLILNPQPHMNPSTTSKTRTKWDTTHDIVETHTERAFQNFMENAYNKAKICIKIDSCSNCFSINPVKHLSAYADNICEISSCCFFVHFPHRTAKQYYYLFFYLATSSVGLTDTTVMADLCLVIDFLCICSCVVTQGTHPRTSRPASNQHWLLPPQVGLRLCYHGSQKQSLHPCVHSALSILQTKGRC